jgi:hypothetical protein
LDICFGHIRLPRWFSRKPPRSDAKVGSNAYTAYERSFVPMSLTPLMITVVTILWLAVAWPA